MQRLQLTPKPGCLVRFENRSPVSGDRPMLRTLANTGLQGRREERGVTKTRVKGRHAPDQCRGDEYEDVSSEHSDSPGSTISLKRSLFKLLKVRNGRLRTNAISPRSDFCDCA
ncbi:hypothetical protein D3C71_1684660 [compost metagenome]